MLTHVSGRVLAVVCLAIVAVCYGMSVAVHPAPGGGGGSALDTVENFAVHPGRANALLVLDLGALLLPVAIGLVALLARPGARALSTWAGLLGTVVGGATGVLVAVDIMCAAAARTADREAAAEVVAAFFERPVVIVYLAVGVAGGLAAFVLLAIALIRAKVVAWPFAVAFPLGYVVGGPFAAPVTGVISTGLLLAGFGACAACILRSGLPAVPVSAATTTTMPASMPAAVPASAAATKAAPGPGTAQQQ
ncbi:hypothetical protein CcI49_30365 [Frankia sp. CcI49]|uniref:hypothetical protein n=1 Tax=Frankia sp. CcI49 TaxID=1745382 RepID=UPI000975DE88|nr:hypothetical protein [Frankia sp. CcI49]ONH54661.1 hypothetical protein CcI49_30365 [Frankia sp. CcI49]